MRELFRGFAAAVLDDPAVRPAVVESDLAGFSRALTASSELREVLSDPEMSTTVRRGVVEDLLSDKAARESVTLLSRAVAVEAATDFVPTVAQLRELVEDAGQYAKPAQRPEPPGGRLAVRERIEGYAWRVLQEVGSLAEIDEVEDEVFRFSRILDAEAGLHAVLGNDDNPLGARLDLLFDLLGGKARPATLRLLAYVLRAGHSRDLVGTLNWLIELIAAERGRRVAQVRAAVDLDDQERRRLSSALSRLVERDVELRLVIDEGVVGGMLVTLGDLLVDGTLRERIARLREELLAPQPGR